MPPVLASPRLSLRALHPADAGPIGLWCGQYRVASMLARVPHPYPPGAAAAFIERVRSGAGGEQAWALDGTPSGAADFLGVISLRPTEDPAVRSLGYWVGPPAWGLGYATESVATVLEAAFADPAIAAVATTVYTDNAPSARVLEKMGFIVTGHGEKYCPARGAVVPENRLRLDRAAWRGAAAVLAASAAADGAEAAE